jgi:molybdopterin converting factor subunit 1
MKVQVRLFAAAKDWANASSIELDVPGGATMAEVRTALLVRVPRLAQFGPQLRLAVNAEYADDATAIWPDADVACIPPVSGG